jgi:hypothetical protein
MLRDRRVKGEKIDSWVVFHPARRGEKQRLFLVPRPAAVLGAKELRLYMGIISK